MTREQFEHAIRAAGSVLGVSELLVIGSQVLHGSLGGTLLTVGVDIRFVHSAAGAAFGEVRK